MDKYAESGYYIVNWTSESDTFQYYKRLKKYVIKAGELVCDVVCLNPLDSFKQWYTTYEDEIGEKTVRLITVISPNVKVKPIY